jgi:hypothetical protein
MESTTRQLEARLLEITKQLEQQMRVRGFDPQQADNVALPAALARLYMERLELLEKLEEIRERANNEGT